MEADFSIRNEIDSVMPPHGDSPNINTGSESVFSENTFKNISPPAMGNFPPYMQEGPPQDSTILLKQMLQQQNNFILQQQKLNYEIIKRLIEYKTFSIWKAVGVMLLIAIAIYAYFHFKAKGLVRNPNSYEAEEEDFPKSERYARYLHELNR
jgi:hypothetical protein